MNTCFSEVQMVNKYMQKCSKLLVKCKLKEHQDSTFLQKDGLSSRNQIITNVSEAVGEMSLLAGIMEVNTEISQKRNIDTLQKGRDPEMEERRGKVNKKLRCCLHYFSVIPGQNS